MKSSYYYPTRADTSNILCHDVGWEELYDRRNTKLTEKLFEYIGEVPPGMMQFVYEPGLHLVVGDPGAGKSYFLSHMDVDGTSDVLQQIGEPLTGFQLKSRNEWSGFLYNLALGQPNQLTAGVSSFTIHSPYVLTTVTATTSSGDVYYEERPSAASADITNISQAIECVGKQNFPTLIDYAMDVGASTVLMFKPPSSPTLITQPFELNVVWQIDSLSDLPFVLTDGGYLPGGIPASLYSALSVINAIAQARRMVVLATFNPTAWTSATRTYFSTDTYASFAGRCLSVMHIQNTGDTRAWSFWGRYIDESRIERRVSTHTTGYVNTSVSTDKTNIPTQHFLDVNNFLIRPDDQFDDESEVTEFD